MKKLKLIFVFLLALTISLGSTAQETKEEQKEQKADSPQSELVKAKSLIQQGNKAEGSKILCSIMATHPDNREAVQFWLIANMKRSPTGEIDAVKSLDSLNEVYPKNTGILFFKAFILVEYGKNEEALPIVEHLTIAQPDSADNWILKGQLLQAMDKSIDAVISFDKAIKLNPARTDVYGMKSASLIKIGKLDEALTTVNTAIELSSNNATAIYNRACIYSLNGNKKEALADLKKAIEINPDLKKYAPTDTDLKSLYDDEEFKKLTK